MDAILLPIAVAGLLVNSFFLFVLVLLLGYAVWRQARTQEQQAAEQAQKIRTLDETLSALLAQLLPDPEKPVHG